MKKKKAATPTEPTQLDGFDYDSGAASSSPLRVEAMSVEGFENAGKTAFALSASELGPIAYIPMDSGWRVADWYRAQGRSVGIHRVLANLPDDVDPDDFLAVSEAMMPKLKELRTACRRAIDQRAFACVLDTGSDVEDLVGLAINGKIGLDVYGGEGRLKKAVSSAMTSLYRVFEESDTNLIVTHKLAQFKDDIYPIGWKNTNYACPYIVRCEFDHEEEDNPESPKRHWVRVVKSKYDPALQGQRFRVGRLTGYGKIAKMLLPAVVSADDDGE